jgi:aconitate hydratase
MIHDSFNVRTTLRTAGGTFFIYSLPRLQVHGHVELDRLPYAIRILLEGALRQIDLRTIKPQDVLNLADWQPHAENRLAMPFKPGRVLMQDLTGVPAIVDLAAMRSTIARLGGDPTRINPLIPVDMVIDHSIQVDHYGSPEALQRNAEIEFLRNRERYEFLHWGQRAFDNFRVVPPATGIVHQINLEFLGEVVLTREVEGDTIAFPDTLVGTDSHTTMINGLGVLGWGVGGIEAEAAMLGQTLDMLTPDVIGVRLTGELPGGATPTDLTLRITELLRQVGVVGKFVEYFGPGLDHLPLADRAMIANMTPEHGATASFFPVDDETLAYLRLSGRSSEQVNLVETYCKAQGLFRTTGDSDPEFTSIIEVDLASIEPSLAGPRRPQDRIPLSQMKPTFDSALPQPRSIGGFEVAPDSSGASAALTVDHRDTEMHHGSVVLAAITSCTNTSNPTVMVGAGLVAKKAVEKGLKVPSHVKTSLAPGSTVVSAYLEKAGLIKPLAQLGFNVVGYGCTTCIGNSGPLPPVVVRTIQENDLVAAAVLSGNRNFEGRVSPHTLANYLASPPLVVVYALAGRVDIDLENEPLGPGSNGEPVYLRDIWPTSQEVATAVQENVTANLFASSYADVFEGNPTWNAIPSSGGDLYEWDDQSTYIHEPPFFANMGSQPHVVGDIHNARVLAVLSDSITTDHISPAGAIPVDGPAGQYLQGRDIRPSDFNTFGSRRGNDLVMVRGTFGNIRLKNQLVPGVEGSFTAHLPENTQMSIFEAAEKYRAEDVPLIVLAGKEYGTGSSRDWAAKGPLLLGVRAVIAESFERIHRSNLVGMGVLPLQFKTSENAASLGLTGHEVFHIEGLASGLSPGQEVSVRAESANGDDTSFTAVSRLDTDVDVEYYQNGGILHTILYGLLKT